MRWNMFSALTICDWAYQYANKEYFDYIKNGILCLTQQRLVWLQIEQKPDMVEKSCPS